MSTPTGKGQTPFAFRLREDTLKACRDMSAEDKLRWLEEANQFVRQFVPPDRLERWERIRRGQDGDGSKA